MKPRGLGKGLNALLSDEVLQAAEEEKGSIRLVDINDIQPNNEQPRKNFSDEELEELSASIKQFGVLQPLIVREKKWEVRDSSR